MRTTRVLFGSWSISFCLTQGLNTTIPYRQLSFDDLFDSRHRFAWRSIAPDDSHKSSPKTDLSYGGDEDAIDAKIDNVPVEYRVEVISQLLATRDRVAMHRINREGIRLANRDASRDEIILPYTRFMIGSTYLEIEFLRIFIRSIYTREPSSALMIVERMRELAGSKWNATMEFLSPRMIIDWSKCSKIPGQFRVGIPLKEPRTIERTRRVTPRTLLNLEPVAWKPIFRDRLHRLKLSGYENIDL